MSKVNQFQLSFVLIAASIVFGLAASTAAGENSGSLDALWSEDSRLNNSNAKDEDTGKLPPSSGQTNSICPLNSFLQSELITTSTWPGLGPFQSVASHPLEFKDKANNHLALNVDNEQVIGAQLDMPTCTNANETFLKLEMTVDFLLESFGIKTAKINTFNLSLEKEMAPQQKGLSATAFRNSLGSVVIAIAPTPTDKASAADALPATFRLVIKAADNTEPQIATAGVNAKSDLASDHDHDLPPGLKKENQSSTTSNNRPNETANHSLLDASSHQNNQDITGVIDSASISGPKHLSPPSDYATSQTSKSPNKGIAGLSKDEKLKQDFLQVIQNWQSTKKKALRQHQTTDLATALGGRALARQSDAIKWLAANHKYYDMTPKSSSIKSIAEILPDKKYVISAQVCESTKYIDERDKQVIKETDDTYNVNYTVEKIAGRWLITDSAIIKPANPSPTSKVRQ